MQEPSSYTFNILAIDALDTQDADKMLFPMPPKDHV